MSRSLALFPLLASVLTVSKEASAQPSCSYDTSSHTLSIQTAPGPPEANYFGEWTLHLDGEVIRFDGKPCEEATLTNTDTINVMGVTEHEAFYVVGLFAPGLTPEPGEEPEIEILVDLGTGDGFNTFGIIGSVGADQLTLGSLGASINTDSDADVTVAGSNLDVFLTGREGNDFLSARGGFGTGGPTTDSVLLLGEAGNDHLFDGLAGDSLQGSGGRDVLAAGLGNDRLFGSGGRDRLRGGTGKDMLVGGGGEDVCRPGPGRDITEGCERPPSLFGPR
jgi:hypothetical protein